MTNEEAARRLEEVNAAISQVLGGGQSIQTPNGRVQFANLSELRAERAALESVLQGSTSSEGGTFGTPMAYFGR
ncbi:hypothetical protein [Phascolarctobacterium sp.]|uniref:hypothetical protein n=1 Tax=Phascolarctobacterium sp. TaxID=2049039 RepID=UPI00386FE503